MTGSFIAAVTSLHVGIKTFHNQHEISQIHVPYLYTCKNTHVLGVYMHWSYVIHNINSYVHLGKLW